MIVSTLSIGDELLSGEITDTNAAFIADRLVANGLRSGWHLQVGDSERDIEDALAFLMSRSAVVIATGGLGPTVDDLTARAAAKATGRQLVLNNEALAHLQRIGEKLGGDIIPLNEKQALIPAKATVVPNPTGTACGFRIDHDARHLFFLPGVPSEMERMIDESVIPFLRTSCTEREFSATRTYKVFGLSEAEAGDLTKEWHNPMAGLSLAFRVAFPEIFIKLRAVAPHKLMLTEQFERAAAGLRRQLADYLYAENDDTMDSVLADLFRTRRLTVATAESCTGGLLAKRLTDTPGSSAYFLQGAVTYADAAKTRILGVPPTLIQNKGAVSKEVAMEMARGMRKVAGSDLALSITGIAGPDGGTADKPVGTVFMALADSKGCQVLSCTFPGSREEIRSLTTFTAMDWLRRHLLI